MDIRQSIIARAGGGDSYSSSSSSSGSSSSYSSSSDSSYSSSSGGTSVSFNLGGIIFLIIFAAIIMANMKKAGKLANFKKNINPTDLAKNPLGELIQASVETALEGSGAAVKTDADIPAKLALIKQADPNFNEQVFKDKAQNAFFKIQEAWEKQDLKIARPFVSDAIMQRYSTQISDMQSRGEKNVLENIVIGKMDIVDINSDEKFNYIKVRIDASCADYTVDSEGKMIRGAKTPTNFVEDWTFIRTAGSVTHSEKELKDNKCPNCGAPLEVNATGQCNYCSAVVSSGQYDWVLSQIDQVTQGIYL